MSNSTAYRPEIDGLRAIAVIAVMIFHAHKSTLPGGFVGVDIFFVISGFLITTILYRELQQGTFSIIGFYDRRIRRIFPALFTVILACLPFAWALMTPDQLKDFSQSILATGLFLSNVYFMLKTGYFEQSANQLPMLHTWSLAVEEQYYIFFPLILMAVVALRQKLLVPVLWGLLIASLWLCLTWGQSRPMPNFFLLPTRGWELLAGALLAIYAPRLRARLEGRTALRSGLEILGLLAIFHALFTLDEHDVFPGLSALPVVIGTVILIGVMGPQTLVGRILGSPVPVGLGLVSYSAYLWHQPLYAFARISFGTLSPLLLVGLFVLTFVLAYLSWRFIEGPFRDRSWLSPGLVIGGGIATIAVFSGVGALGHLWNGVPERFDAQTRVLVATAARSPKREECHTDGLDYLPPAQACQYNDGPATWAVFGDSHGVELAIELAETLKPLGQAVQHLTFSGCPPALQFSIKNPGCEAWVKDALTSLEQQPDLQSVVIVYRHGYYLYGDETVPGTGVKHLAPTFITDADPQAAEAAYWASLHAIVDRLKAAGKTVYLLTPIPELPVHIERLLYDTRRPLEARATSALISRGAYDTRNAEILGHLSAMGATVIPLQEVLCDATACQTTKDGSSYYFDNNHLSLAGARQVVTHLVTDGTLPIKDSP